MNRRASRGVLAIAVVAFVSVVAVRVSRERARNEIVERCLDALGSAPRMADPYERGSMVANACGALYAESGCRDAYARAWARDTDPSQRSRIAIEGCRDAYCPLLPAPKPALCDQAEVNLLTGHTTWPEFVRVVLIRDLGEARAERVLTAMRAASPGATSADDAR